MDEHGYFSSGKNAEKQLASITPILLFTTFSSFDNIQVLRVHREKPLVRIGEFIRKKLTVTPFHPLLRVLRDLGGSKKRTANQRADRTLMRQAEVVAGSIEKDEC